MAALVRSRLLVFSSRVRSWLATPRGRLTREVAAVLVLTLVSVWLFFVVRREPISSDDCSYFDHAAGYGVSGLHHKQRLVVVASTYLSQAVFGYNLTAYYAVALSYGVGLVLAVYALSRTLVGVSMALLCALCFFGQPVFLQNYPLLLPDIPSLFWFVLGLLLAFLVFIRERERQLGLAVASGVALFLSVSAKESSITLLPGTLLLPWLLRDNRQRWRLYFVIAATVLVLEVVQSVGFLIAKGDFLHRLHAVTGDHVQRMNVYATNPKELPQNIDWLHLLTRFFVAQRDAPKLVPFLGAGYWSWFLGSLAAALLVAGLRRDRRVLVLAGVMIVGFAALTFTVVSFDPLIPMVRSKARYFLSVTVLWPIVVIGALARGVAAQRPRVKPWVWLPPALALSGLAVWFTISFAAEYALHSSRTIRNGSTRVRDTGRQIRRLQRAGFEIERVLGTPKPVRAGRVVWTWGDFKTVRLSKTTRYRRYREGDLLIAPSSVPPWSSERLIQRILEPPGRYDFGYFRNWKEPLEPGHYRLFSADREMLSKRGSSLSQRLRIKLEAKGTSAVPKPVTLLLYRSGRSPSTRRLRWKHRHGKYHIDTKTAAYSPLRVSGVALDLRVAGRGKLRLLKKRVEIVDD